MAAMSDQFVGRGMGVSDQGQPGLLIDVVGPKIGPRDDGLADVRAAAREVGERENKHRIASEVGADGVNTMEAWDRRIEQVGPNAAAEAARIWASAPRFSAPEEEKRDSDSDHQADTRRAYHAAVQKQQLEASMPQALAGLDRLERRHGNLGVVSKFQRWNDQLRANPGDAAPRIAAEIAQQWNDNNTMAQAHKVVSDYEARVGIPQDKRPIMQELLLNGNAGTLEMAASQADWLLAEDVEDKRLQPATAAWRQRQADEAGGVAMLFAAQEVAEWDKKHPNVGQRTRATMRSLLENGHAQDLDDAYRQAKQR
jgi:hypothetical protein